MLLATSFAAAENAPTNTVKTAAIIEETPGENLLNASQVRELLSPKTSLKNNKITVTFRAPTELLNKLVIEYPSEQSNPTLLTFSVKIADSKTSFENLQAQKKDLVKEAKNTAWASTKVEFDVNPAVLERRNIAVRVNAGEDSEAEKEYDLLKDAQGGYVTYVSVKAHQEDKIREMVEQALAQIDSGECSHDDAWAKLLEIRGLVNISETLKGNPDFNLSQLADRIIAAQVTAFEKSLSEADTLAKIQTLRASLAKMRTRGLSSEHYADLNAKLDTATKEILGKQLEEIEGSASASDISEVEKLRQTVKTLQRQHPQAFTKEELQKTLSKLDDIQMEKYHDAISSAPDTRETLKLTRDMVRFSRDAAKDKTKEEKKELLKDAARGSIAAAKRISNLFAGGKADSNDVETTATSLKKIRRELGSADKDIAKNMDWARRDLMANEARVTAMKTGMASASLYELRQELVGEYYSSCMGTSAGMGNNMGGLNFSMNGSTGMNSHSSFDPTSCARASNALQNLEETSKVAQGTQLAMNQRMMNRWNQQAPFRNNNSQFRSSLPGFEQTAQGFRQNSFSPWNRSTMGGGNYPMMGHQPMMMDDLMTPETFLF